MKRRNFLGLLACLCAPAALAASDRDDKITCTKLRTRIAEIRLKLRMGYTARQGRLYRQKLAGLEAEQKIRCR